MGLPCAHTLMRLIQDDGVVTPNMFHNHWHLASAIQLSLRLPTISAANAVAGSSTAPTTLAGGLEDDFEPLQYIRNPPPAAHKGRPRFTNVQRVYDEGRHAPRASTSQVSTQRDPSAFEWAEGVARRSTRCSLCKKEGTIVKPALGALRIVHLRSLCLFLIFQWRPHHFLTSQPDKALL